MAETAPSEHLSRPEAIAQLREKLRSLSDADHCVCTVAQRLGLPCQGFAQISDEEFHRRFAWIAGKRPGVSRAELTELVNLYLLARQEATGAAVACDIETREHDLCGGWNSFDNPTLEGFFQRVFGRSVTIG
ncbi:MAG TPA: hypothetical protein VMH79_11545 [Thermoanaerobaculia bacterium]|nr:hypothetical protein [Thermoanaerobaculia bacterium]